MYIDTDSRNVGAAAAAGGGLSSSCCSMMTPTNKKCENNGPRSPRTSGTGTTGSPGSALYQSSLHSGYTRADRIVMQTLDGSEATERCCCREHEKPVSLDGPTARQAHVNKQTTSLEEDNDITTSSALHQLASLTDPQNNNYEVNIFSKWDNSQLPNFMRTFAKNYYIPAAQCILRNPADVVFVTHLIIYCVTLIPSAIYLYFVQFSLLHAGVHFVYAMWCAGAFTLLLHNHIHQNGLFRKDRTMPAILDWIFPYILCPLMGHTWNTYYYHHKQMHHVEGNGPNDLSSTLRYQRDAPLEFLKYLGRFLLLIWYDLPMYFWRTKRRKFACKAVLGEFSSYAFLVSATWWNWRAALPTLLLPFLLLRIGLMAGNWGQHALVDEVDPTSDFRSSITLLDIASNRYCFNDGYHTSHHLNPVRHWRAHPHHFLSNRQTYAKQHALTFFDIDYLMITIRLLCKDYGYLADRLVPMGEEQTQMSRKDVAEMLRRKTKKFTEEDIKKLYQKQH